MYFRSPNERWYFRRRMDDTRRRGSVPANCVLRATLVPVVLARVRGVSRVRRVSRVVVRTDVGVVVLYHVDRRFLRRCRAAVDPGVARDKISLSGRMSSLVLGYQAARPRIRAVVEQEPVEVLVRLVLVVTVFGQFVVDVEGRVRLLLAEPLV